MHHRRNGRAPSGPRDGSESGVEESAERPIELRNPRWFEVEMDSVVDPDRYIDPDATVEPEITEEFERPAAAANEERYERAPSQGAALATIAAPTVSLPLVDQNDLFSLTRRIALQSSLKEVDRLLRARLLEFLHADRVYVRYVDPSRGALFEFDATLAETPVFGGLSLEVARRYEPAMAEQAASLPGYDRRFDDPAGTGEERIVCTPFGPPGALSGVVVAVRKASRPAFGNAELAVLHMLSASAGALIQDFLVRHISEMQALVVAEDSMYRREALVERRRSKEPAGAMLDITPGWVRWSYRIVFIAAAIALLFSWFFHVDEYSSGPALIQRDGKIISASVEGIVEKIPVSIGDRVKKGAILFTLGSSDQLAELRGMEKNYEQKLAAFLLDPAEPQAKSDLFTIKSAVDAQKQRVDQRIVRAPEAGRVNDLRARPGMLVRPGDLLATISQDNERTRIVALLPGSHRPRLKKGMMMRFEINGYKTRRIDAVVEQIGSEVIGPREAARYLGAQADATPLGGPVVLVFARLTKETFASDGQAYDYHQGMIGTAEVKIRSDRLLKIAIPALKEVF